MDGNTFYAPSKHTRENHDHYSTPPELAAALVVGLDRLGIAIPHPVFDPCAGEGRLLATLDTLGIPGGFGADLFPAAYPRRKWIHEEPIDARDHAALYEVLGPCRSILTNPPTEDATSRPKLPAPKNALERRFRKNFPRYAKKELAADIATAGMKLLEMGAIELFALLLPLPWEAAGGSRRLALMRSPLFRGRVVCCWRPEWIAGTSGGGKMNHAWLIWALEGAGGATTYVAREEAMRELGVDEKPARSPKARKPKTQLSLFDEVVP